MSQYNEPWTVENNDDDEIFICSQQTCCEETSVSKNIEKSDAVRIVACVNACEGIDNSTLEIPGYSIKAELDSLDNQINGRLKAERQRDELLLVLDDVLMLASTRTTKGELVYIDFDEIRSVVEKVKASI